MGTEGQITGNGKQLGNSKRSHGATRIELLIVVILLAILMLLVTIAAVPTKCWNRKLGEIKYDEITPANGPTVSLAIDFGNGVKHEFNQVDWMDGMTVDELMLSARRTSPGLNYEVKGSGEMTMLTSLDGVTNGEGNGRYWLYSVNDKPGEVSFAVQPLAAGDRVLWKFSEPE